MPRLLLLLGVAIAAVAIAVAVFVYNGDTAASECPVQKDEAAAIDAAALGELAAVNPTGEGRGFSTLSFEDDAGKRKTIKDFAGKMLVVNFWATWCVPCRTEMPELDALAAAYNSDSFMVLPINLDIGDEGVRKAKAFLDQGGWAHLPLYADPTFQAFERLKTEAVAIGLPATLVLDAKGCELAVLQGPAEWNSPDGHKLVEALIGLKS